MAAQFKGLKTEDVENKLCQIKNIQAARVINDDEGNIQEIHILAHPEKPPKQLVRDIESALMIEYGIPINHRKISVVQVHNDEVSDNGDKKQEKVLPEEKTPTETPTEKQEKSRLKIISINAETRGSKVKIKVVLEVSGTEYEGTAEGPASKSGIMRLVSMAALDAISKFSDNQSSSFVIEDVGFFNLAHEKIAVVCVAVVDSSGEQLYVGSAVVKKNEKDTIVRATLDAVNRRLNI